MGTAVGRVFDGWRREYAPRLRELAVADSPKELIRDLSEDLLHRFAGQPLLDRYDTYQCLMDYWDEVMQDDVYLVVTEGWTEAARPRVLVPVKGKGTAETPDLTVNRKKYKMDLVPPRLVVARYFAREQAEVDQLRTEQESIARELDEFVEEYSGEDGLLEGATSDAGKVTQAAVRARLKAVGGDPEGQEERDVLEVCLDLMKALAAAKRAAKAAQTRAGFEGARAVREADCGGDHGARGRRQVDGKRRGRDRAGGGAPDGRAGGSGPGAGGAVFEAAAGARVGELRTMAVRRSRVT